ncbi:hypothetical protein WMF30_37275 [Sorangium sp. So ce134]
MNRKSRYFLIGRDDGGFFVIEGTRRKIDKEISYHGGKEVFLPSVPLDHKKMEDNDLVLIKGSVIVPDRPAGVVPERPTSDIRRMWPVFGVPRIPLIPLLNPFVAFAAALMERTAGMVRACVVPTLQRDRYEFVLYAATHPMESKTAFIIINELERIRIHGWSGSGDLMLDSDTKVLEFLRRFAAARETRDAVRELMLLDPSFRFG